ncbi:hypothetical protein CG747_20710 [Streptomyces sp. CB02959]|nr:hypothetical protein CG747_20710 [Streptomyces sp. CB02959]
MLAYGLYQGADTLLTAQNRTGKPVDVNDVIKTTVTVLTLVGAVLTGIYAYRKQLLAEGDAHRADASQLADRYSAAAEQLGHEQAAVRLAGVYAMARLADDWPEQRQVCIDVLCAYLRMPYEPEHTATGFKTGEREVRLTIIRTISDHLQDPTAPTTWCGRNLNFTGAIFDGGHFSRAHFTEGLVDFGGAQFTGDTVNFLDAKFIGGTVSFVGAQFTGDTVGFLNAQFIGGSVTFGGAQFVGDWAMFNHAQVNDGVLHFGAAKFIGGIVSFSEAQFTGGTVSFVGAQVTNATVSFGGVQVGSNANVLWGPFPVISPGTS